ncbi:hypothetical protein QF042_001189 [Pedobacter sp. W3I1]|uniref:S41 family peptidase n=1 Tax=Pedobacter sp. W3I1 TaxID=3042291 RepID=UPI002784F9A9|nr:S41 family peptidase [Pedobacter sp. W3I1]MDQ0637624.1 hypothetical protein [Pedobacter sp. W3I1]
MKKIIFYLLLLFPFYNLQAQNCNCGDNFSFMVQHIKKNYVGYTDKVNPKTQKRFEYLTDSLQKVARYTASNKCLAVCREWISFFKDGHMNISFNESSPKDEIRVFFSKEEKTIWDEEKLKTYLSKYKNQTDNIEGIWRNVAKTHQYGIVRDSLNQNEFIGFVVKADGVMWIPQQIKFRVRKTEEVYKFSSFFARDHSPYPARVTLNKDTMDLKEIGKFYKNDLPGKPLSSSKSPKFERLSDKIALLTIPSFYLEYKNETDSLMIKNAPIIKNIDHLIIDLRDNRGGAVGAFEKILPYLYTNPIFSEKGQILATDDNIKDGYEKPLPDLPEDLQEYFKKIISKLKAHRGELYLAYPADTIKYDKIFKKPSRVSILMNDGSASASELFILQAKQSSKVKLFGTNSSGSVNYVESVTTQMPCNFFNLIYPAARLMRASSDGTDPGIKPDIEIPANVTNWIDFVKKYKN